jgi:succinoglycan biosynthesis transport protein ExoP
MRETEQTPGLQLRDALAALWRRRRTVIATLAAGVLTTLLLALLLPSSYQSTGIILIEQQEVPQDLVRSVINSYADERVQTINQRVMTTQNLLDIIRRHDLYADKRKYDSREELIERMRKDVAFKMINADVVDPRSGLPRQATIAFSVSYQSRSPDHAVKVANDLVTLYLNENLNERNQLAQDTSSFMREESTRIEKQVAELEAKLADFKSRHVEALPELTPAKLQFLDRARQELSDAQVHAMSLQQQRAYLEAQLAEIKPNSEIVGDDGRRILTPADRLRTAKSQLASDEALYAPTHPDVERLKREIAGLEAQQGAQPATNELLRELDTAQGELAQARQKYTPEHPDVQRLDQQVTSLQTALAAQPAATAGAATSQAALGGAPDNPAYIQLRAQLAATSSDLAALDSQMRELRGRIAGYQHDIASSPALEKEYSQLTSEYETARLKYQEVRTKQMEAQVGQNMEADRKGERFTLIEPPLPPEEPVSPNRPLILILGLILSLALGAGAAAVLESTDLTVRGRRDVIDLLEAPPLATVPRIIIRADVIAATRRRQLALWATAAGGVAAVVLTHFLYRPLDVLWFTALRHLGM